MKSRAFRNGKLVPSDQRVYTMRLVNSIGVLESCLYLYPKIYDVGSFHIGVGDINEFGLMQLPPIVRVSTDRLKPTSVYIAGIDK
jgi:protein transport protein SEC24